MLRKARHTEQVTALAERAIAHIALDEPYAVAYQLQVLGSRGGRVSRGVGGAGRDARRP
jgi:hypothetical protein